MNTNMTGFRGFSKMFGILVLWTKVASALEGLKRDALKDTLLESGVVIHQANSIHGVTECLCLTKVFQGNTIWLCEISEFIRVVFLKGSCIAGFGLVDNVQLCAKSTCNIQSPSTQWIPQRPSNQTSMFYYITKLTL